MTRTSSKHAAEIPPEHRDSAKNDWRPGHPEQRASQHVDWTGPHVILSDTVPHPSRPPVFVAGAHGTEVFEVDRRIVPTDRHPPKHSAAVAVDAVPHQLADKPADLLEA